MSFSDKEGEWREHRREHVSQTTSLVGNLVRIEGTVITVETHPIWSATCEDDPTHKLRFETTHYWRDPVDQERVKKFATYAAHAMRLLRAADEGDQWSIDKLEQLVSEEPPYVAEHRKNLAEMDEFLKERLKNKVESDD